MWTIPILITVAAVTLTYFYSFEDQMGVGYAPKQPLSFSHKMHTQDLKINCTYCHTEVFNNRHATLPSLDMCMKCHQVVKTETKEVKELISRYEKGTPVHWNRVHRLPDYVYFDHKSHVQIGIDCNSCHGAVKDMDHMQQTRSFHMRGCLDCHRQAKELFPANELIKKGPLDCSACHR